MAYALLWLNVLSPHGVLLTAFLKQQWNLSEPVIGFFRGAGSLVGLGTTFLFPWLLKKNTLVPTAKAAVFFQLATLILALACFLAAGVSWPLKIGFLALVVASRFGLYGFTLAQTQLRQQDLEVSTRGFMNGYASSLTNAGVLTLYGTATFIARPNQFPGIVVASVFFVFLGAGVFAIWAQKRSPVEN